MRRIILAIVGAALLAAVVAGIRRRSREAAPTRPPLVSESVVIERPPDEVFAYVTEPQNIPEWVEVIREVRKETEGPPREGEHFTVAIDIGFLGRRWEPSFEVTAYEPPRRYSDRRNLGGPFQDEHTYTFEEAGGGGTRLSLAMEAHPGSFFRIIEPLLEKAIQRQVRKELGTLKDVLEARG
jgi:uncharacterized protein YndB with AHSA1/START domain